MQRSKKRSGMSVDSSGPNQAVRHAAMSYITTLRDGLLRLERECLPKRRGRPFLHHSPGKAFDPAARRRMTRRDFLRHLILRMDTAQILLHKDDGLLAYHIAREVEAQLPVLSTLAAV